MLCDDIMLMLLIMMQVDACEVDDGAVAIADAAIVDEDGIDKYNNHDDVGKDDGIVFDDNDDIFVMMMLYHLSSYLSHIITRLMFMMMSDDFEGDDDANDDSGVDDIDARDG